MADTKPTTDAPAVAATATPEPQSEVAKRVLTEKEEKVKVIMDIVDGLTLSELDSVRQYAQNQVTNRRT